MAVLQCGGCDRFISVSIVPGGNPVALADPERWSVVRRVCDDCRKSFCDRCAPSVRTPCPSCGGDFEGAPSGGPSAADTAAFVQAVASARRYLTAAVVLAAVWVFAHAVSTSGFRAIFYVAAALAGVVGLWKYLKALEKPAWVFFAACCGVLVPWLNLAVLLLFRVMTDMSLRSAARAQGDEPAGEPPARAAGGAAGGRPRHADAAQARATAAYAMAAAASAPAQPQDPLDAFGARLAAHWGKPLRPYSTVDFGRGREPSARSFIVPKDRAIPMVMAVRKAGLPPGLIIFEGTGRWLGEENHGDQVELVLARGQSSFDAIRVARTDPVNHGLSAEDVVARLERYNRSFGVEVFQADTESVVFRLSKLPSSLDRFVKDLQDFCPDSVEEGLEEEVAKGIVESQGWVALWWD